MIHSIAAIQFSLAKKALLLGCLFSAGFDAFCQESKLNTYRRPDEGYYLYEIPSAINGSNIDPSPYSNITANTADASLSFKYGSLSDASLSSQVPKAPSADSSTAKIPLIKYFFFQINAKATNGVSSLFTKGNPAPDIGLSGGFTPYFRSTYWKYTRANDPARVGTISTRWSRWVNIRASGNVATYNLFSQLDPATLTKEKVTSYPYSVFISWNSFYSSDFNFTNKLRSSIFSFGGGYAKTNNYASLKKRTFEDGSIYLNPNGTSYKAITEQTSGAIGDYKQYEGLATYLELYKPLTKLSHDNSRKYNFYVGARATYYGLLRTSHTINANGGLFLNIKKGNIDVTKRREDALNIAVLANFLDLDALNEKRYWADKFSVSLSASVPLKLD